MSEQIYNELRERINEYSIGFNATASKVEIEILTTLFSIEEANMYMNLSRALEPTQVIAEKSGLSEDMVIEILTEMTRKGLTFPITRNDIRFFAAAPFIHGIFEHSAIAGADNPQFKHLAKLMDQYFKGGFVPTGYTLRTIPVSEEIIPDTPLPVAPLDDVKKIIMSKTKIGLFDCACAVKTEALEQDCHQKKEVCIGFDFYAEYAIEGLKSGRWITQEEALEVINQAEEDGLVHQIGGDSRNVEAICNCCKDCCGILSQMKQFPEPSLLAATNYVVAFDVDDCVNCLSCVERCPMDAITEEETSVMVNAKRCIGCGLCTSVCDPGALSLQLKPEDQQTGIFDPANYRFMRSTVDFEADIAKYESEVAGK